MIVTSNVVSANIDGSSSEVATSFKVKAETMWSLSLLNISKSSGSDMKVKAPLEIAVSSLFVKVYVTGQFDGLTVKAVSVLVN